MLRLINEHKFKEFPHILGLVGVWLFPLGSHKGATKLVDPECLFVGTEEYPAKLIHQRQYAPPNTE